MNPQEVLNRTRGALIRSYRQASVAKLVAPLDQDSQRITSSFGGGFFLDPQEPWPTIDGRPLLPILQIRIDELPYVHPRLREYSLVQVFVMDDYYPEDRTESGSNWLLKTYPGLTGLAPAFYPGETDLKHCFIRWDPVEQEAPGRDDWAAAIGDELMSAFFELDSDLTDCFFDEFTCEAATKVGGWTQWIQNSVTDDPVIQIENEKAANWFWPGGGFACIHYQDDPEEWHMSLDLP